MKQNFSVAEEIKKLKELLDSGAITQEEFDRKKSPPSSVCDIPQG